MQLPTFVPNALGWLAYQFVKARPFIPTYIHLIVSAMLPIYAGAHSSLSRPSSAAKAVKSPNTDEIDEKEEEDEPLRMEGLSPTDALLFPLMAGTTLAGLYFLIKWLQDPTILNKILNWYFATFSVFSVSRLISDALDVLHSLLFPHDYVQGGVLFHVNSKAKRAIPVNSERVSPRSTPLPGFLARLPLPQSITNFLWSLHVLPNRKLTFKAFLRGLGPITANLGIHGIEGLTIGLASVLYYNFVSKPWWLTNLMGFGFAYGSLQMLSPTTFWTGTLILSGLFFYDIYFVFYTPMMVTVAKSLDIPIKLLFPRPPEPGAEPASRAMSMLGLGDVVLPGIMIGLALRFDLYMYYLRKQAQNVGDASTGASSKQGPIASQLSATPETSPATGNSSEAQPGTNINTSIVKSPYQSVAEGWGDRLWTSSFFSKSNIKYTARGQFPKPYFHASLGGYLVGMLATLGAMQVFNHAQPALLYLVPGVLSSLWLTGTIRGETTQMWNFSDAAEEEQVKETTQSEDEKAAQGDVKTDESLWDKLFSMTSFFSTSRSEERAKNVEKFTSKHVKSADESKDATNAKDKDEAVEKTRKDRTDDGTFFSFSIITPELFPESQTSKQVTDAQPGKTITGKKPATRSSDNTVSKRSSDDSSSSSEGETTARETRSSRETVTRQLRSSRLEKSEEHLGKRQRLK